MKEAKRKVQITEQICRQAQLMRKGGANQQQVADLLGVNSSTVSRIEAAGFDFATYAENRRIRKEKEEKRKHESSVTISAEDVGQPEQVPGQMEMELTTAEGQKSEMSDQTKLMRFQAGQVEKMITSLEEWANTLSMKLEKLNDTMSMILRCVRKD